MPRRILIAEDDDDVREALSAVLEREGFTVSSVSTGDAIVDALRTTSPDLLLLDLGLPVLPGIEALREIRRMGDTPIIIISGRDDEADKVLGLELGADDYITKPVANRELVARVRTVLRRGSPARRDQGASNGALEVDVATRDVSVNGTPVELTAKEFDLLAFLVDRPRQVFTREQLLDRVWGDRWRDPATVTEHVRRLRLKIEADPNRPRLLRTVRGVGYRFEEPRDAG